MAVARSALRLLQAGIEATRGTAVAATRDLPFNDAAHNDGITYQDFTDQVPSSLARRRTPPAIRMRVPQITWESFANFDDFGLIPETSLASTVAASTALDASAGNVVRRIWTPSTVNAPTIRTATLEFILQEGSTPRAYEMPYAFCTEWGVTVGVDTTPTMNASFMGLSLIHI